MSHLIGIYLVQVVSTLGLPFLQHETHSAQATILITSALYKAIQRGIKYTPNGSQLSPMRARSILAGQYLECSFDVVLFVLTSQSSSLSMSSGVSYSLREQRGAS